MALAYLSFEDLLGFQFLTYGLIGLFLTVVSTILVTKDLRKMKLILLPMHFIVMNIGFGVSILAGVVFGLLFVFEAFSFRGLSDYFVQIRHDVASVAGEATGFTKAKARAAAREAQEMYEYKDKLMEPLRESKKMKKAIIDATRGAEKKVDEAVKEIGIVEKAEETRRKVDQIMRLRKK